MPNKESIQFDRSGDVIFEMEIVGDTGKLSIKKVAMDPISGKNITIPFDTKRGTNGDAITKMLSLRRPIRDDSGNVTSYEEVMSTDVDLSGLSELEVSINQPDELEWWFDKTIMIGSIRLDSSVITVEQEPIQRIIPTELRLAINMALPAQQTVLNRGLDGIEMPQTDLHTHYAGIMTADILISGIKEKQKSGKKIEYPIKYLLAAGISLDDMKVYFKDDATLGDANTQFEKLVADYKADPDKTTFDLTKMVIPEHETDEQNISNLEKLKDILQIPANKTIIFDEMEKFYEYRDILIKDKELLAHFLREISQDYVKQGLKYVEISFSKVTEPEWLKIIEKTVPAIEEETGVQIRFLGIIARTATKEMRESQVTLFETFASHSPYVLGIDLLAAEVNSTYDVLPELISLCEWANTHYPGMVVRVHAGETSYHPENIAGVVDLARRYPNINFRVGHGIYGVHDDVIAEMKQLKNIIPEINMSSNVTLNMHGSVGHHTLFQYIDNGIPVVLGSDGHGLYQSERMDLIKLLSYAEGIDIPAFTQRLKAVEDQHISFVNKVFPERIHLFLKKFFKAADAANQQMAVISGLCPPADKATLDSIFQQLEQDHSTPGMFIDPSGKPTAYSTEITELYESLKTRPQFDAVWKEMHKEYVNFKRKCDAKNKERSIAYQRSIEMEKGLVREFCTENQITVLHDSVKESAPDAASSLDTKTPIMISGIISEKEGEERRRIISETSAMIQTLLETSDPAKFYFATTGVNIGVQKIVHELVSDYNQKNPERAFDLVGYQSNSVKRSELSEKLTHLVIVDVQNVYQMYQYIDKKVRSADHGLKLVCIGGSMWNKDVIQIVSNALRDPSLAQASASDKQGQLFLYTGTVGAAADKGRELPPHYSANDFVKMIPKILDAPIADASLCNMVFSKNLSHYRQIDLATLESSHGREHPSTASELANKAMQSLKGRFESQLTSDNLEGFFSALIHREPIKTTTLSETMKANPELNMEIMKLAKAFGLVETVTTLRNPRPRPSSHTTTSRWEQLRLNDDEISTEINEPSLDATADQHLSESDDDEEGLNLTAEQMGVVAEHPPSEDVKESEEDSLLEKRSGQKK